MVHVHVCVPYQNPHLFTISNHALPLFFFGIGTTFQSYNLSMYTRDFIFLSFYSIYTHLLSNHTLYVGCSFGPTISNSPKVVSHILSTKQLISFILVFVDFFVYKELWKNNRIFCKKDIFKHFAILIIVLD